MITKPADKGQATVIQNRLDYIQESLQQLSVKEYYQQLMIDPKTQCQREIKSTLEKAVRIGNITDEMMGNLYKENPHISHLYLLPRIHKKNNPERLIMNSIGNITETMSVFVDE